MFEDKNPFYELLNSIRKLFRSIFSTKIVKILFVIACFAIGLGSIWYGFIGVLNTTQTEIVSCPDLSGAESLKLEESSSGGCVPWGRVFIDVGGAVNSPGLYQLDVGSRIAEAINMAGGFSSLADKDFVNHQLNMAQKIADGDKVYVPFEGESNKSQDITGSGEPAHQEKISLNQAKQGELEGLPDVGEKRALDIIKNRPYLSLNELTEKEVIGEALYAKIIEYLEL